MALQHFGFIVKAPGLDPSEHTMTMASDVFQMTAVGVSRPDQALDVAKRMVSDGIQLIELCGGFGPLHTSKVIEAIDAAVPVGAVGYGPEAIDQMYALFAD